ncbi:hypothetical protein FA95DRAFT_112940 [Auriscalpium vulgare]|uniref:Uncharacterized protein n=1 Tax=Auriscalpium vulgare TaxID=40419 RepID=A0ACB8S8A6_9AGAM|nr:hypothetical protein FA95DRAFT_112940 [Auriscalpium vulgare]
MWLKSARIPPELEETLQSIPISVDEVTRDRISRHARAREYSWVLIASPDQYICANPQGPPLERQKDRPSCTSRLPILRLDPFLQSYFSEARAVATRTLHPLVIRAEADLLATWLSRDRLTPPYHSREDRLTIFGRVLFFAAIADIRTTRSVALLVFQMLKALKSESLQKDFRNKIGTDLMKVFQWAWGQNITRQLTAFKPRDGGDCRFDAVRNDVLNMTAPPSRPAAHAASYSGPASPDAAR